MKFSSGIVLAIGLMGLTGCNEFVKTDEQTATSSSSIDVVGEPADPIPDSMSQADILGSVVPSPDDSASVSDANAGRETDNPRSSSDAVETEDKPDVAGGLGLARPVSLKTKKSEVQPAKPSKP